MEIIKTRLIKDKEGALKEFLIFGILFGVFIIAMIGGYNYLAQKNNSPNLLLQNQQINNTYEEYLSNLSTFSSTANTSKTAFETENPSFTAGFLLFGSIISAVKNFVGAFIGIFNIFFTLLGDTLGISPLILEIISGLMIILIIFMAWRVYKLGA